MAAKGTITEMGYGSNHIQMEGRIALADEQFELTDGSMTDAPGQSGIASHDINCRCFTRYKLVSEEEYIRLSNKNFEGKAFTNDKKNDIINKKEYIGKPIRKTDNQHVREWYVANVSDIPNQIDKSKPFEEQVHQAFDLRNKYKHEARVAMSDKETAAFLERKRPVKSFAELLSDKMDRKGLSREEALKDIFETAAKTNKDINREFNL